MARRTNLGRLLDGPLADFSADASGATDPSTYRPRRDVLADLQADASGATAPSIYGSESDAQMMPGLTITQHDLDTGGYDEPPVRIYPEDDPRSQLPPRVGGYPSFDALNPEARMMPGMTITQDDLDKLRPAARARPRPRGNVTDPTLLALLSGAGRVADKAQAEMGAAPGLDPAGPTVADGTPPGSMRGFFANAIRDTASSVVGPQHKPLVPPEVASYVERQVGEEQPDTSALDAARKSAARNDILASLTDQLEIANGKFDAGRSARLHGSAQGPVDEQKEREQAVRDFVARKLGLERQNRQDTRQADQDALNVRNIESQIAARERVGQPKPQSELDAEKERAEIDKLKAESERLRRQGRGGRTPKPTTADVKKQQALTEIQDRYNNIKRQLHALKDLVSDKNGGTFDLLGPHNKIIDQKISDIATDMAKLVDPNSVARESEVEGFKKKLFSPTPFMQNSTAQSILDNFESDLDARLKNAYEVRGLDAPSEGSAQPEQAPPSQPAEQDSAAVAWARAHPDDPRATEILRLNGVR